ncbi:hypothetical protein RJT17_35145 [Streptomyces sp. P5-A9]|uniref:hypothetical protein n=1 Tax=Streptomyces sp. P5-A9 TaxID=3071730 RepID=UPI002FC86ECE
MVRAPERLHGPGQEGAADRERLREPEELFADGRQALAGLEARTAATTDSSRSSDAGRARALQRLATERAGLATITPAAAPQQLGRTA